MGHFRKNMVSVFLTDVCNLNCAYCYVPPDSGRFQYIDVEFALCGIRDFFSRTNRPAVRFFASGEPTMAFDELVYIRAAAARMSGGRAQFELQTNGVFDEPVARWIAANMDIVYVSMDGPPAYHDVLRPTRDGGVSSDRVQASIEVMRQNPDLQLGVRATITSVNNDDQRGMIDYFHSLGIGIVFADLMFSQVGAGDSWLPVDHRRFVDSFVDAREHAERLGVFYGTMHAVNFDEKVDCACRSVLPTPHLTVDGYVSCCDMCVSGDSPLSELIYGEYDRRHNRISYSDEAIRRIRSRRPWNIPACRQCPVRDHCAGGCLGEALNESGDFLGVKADSCLVTRYLWNKLGGQPISLPYLHP